MKKFFIALMAAAASCFGAYAVEPGDMAVGVNLGVAPVVESHANMTNFGLGAKFQYGLTSDVRLEADVDYFFPASGLSFVDVTLNGHYLFPFAEGRAAAYPLVGLGYGNIHSKWDNYSRFVFNIGAGVEYNFTENITGCFELKYQYVKDFSRIPISVGVAYHF